MSQTDSKILVGPKVCLMGVSGTGKTFALGTLAEWCEKNGFELAILFTENGLETFLGYFRDKGKEPPPCCFWHQQLTKPVSLKSLIQQADNVGKLSYESLAKSVDGNRGGDNNAFWKILGSCADFKDDRTGTSLGSVDEFPAKRIFAMDSLTETSNAAMKMQIGSRPMASPGDYGVAQNTLMNFLRLLTQGVNCPFVMTAHVDRETDQVTQSTKIMIKAIGKALATEIPTLFSDVIYTVRDGTKFTWDTAAYGVDTKTRSLGYKAGILPDFALVFDVWKKRAGL
ncbi:AAA domain containing protein [uncultured Caudovirales phage]|uniref:AAA domain containing protein n=1 Tax=uncultured Caudovirales phage TaxID=2100421 RepID=A0A6J5QE77_9CAUD|nr:AAA domain containing protein [uncultured Caudovirales phage]CAB4169770.1 AAA domain containing protein [uncultured Caudovirales phage]CAB4182779.1 AAA domain containing protein [uncultured Caudovirales phage]CAB4197976.1 AAA domain containing protein [uncultured Caudovirales phage]CAB4211659.1 AAA domain containing protein [uncultured Caudovirales phage]